jgi:hypothetical protein
MPKRRFTHLPIVSAEIDEKLYRVLSNMEEFYLHQSEFSAYLPILRSMDSSIGGPAPMPLNISLSPGPGPFKPREAMNAASHAFATAGHVAVFAAGNDGPAEGTISPWSVAPWVIGVGATTQEGTRLLADSSIGTRDPPSAPTVVACGETTVPLRRGASGAHATMVALVILGKDQAGRNLPDCTDVEFSGTSVSTPKVTRICFFLILLLRIFLSVDGLLKKKLMEGYRFPAKDDVQQIIDEILARGDIGDSGFGLLREMQLASLQPMFQFFAEARRLNIYPRGLMWPEDEQTPFQISAIKQILKSIARPVPDCEPHQVGYGFVSDELMKAYLLSFCSVDLLRIVFASNYSSIIGNWRNPEQPLIPPELLAFIIDQMGTTSTMTSYDVV